ncbi:MULTISPECIES: helix-turn-helix domain-containing protein [Bacillus]|uniref:Transcriptional regulator n=1 Tax=Bacillus thuringiensis serovar yosoo TaxID=180848 RepID=A0A9X6FBG4_BACTU|nr:MULTISPECIES: helix-turn-helix transcriptional regulator [Bacillus cereus group]MDA2185924.1 helix-turn-helix transcriptional regulator [Bacillus cereus]MDA2396327.1 helix-turn-helix transcriptional regulator [Bacillus cereus]MDW8785428.1 helix-turn-helix transcriptional regulator [Bacillus cereus]MDZ4492025.1 helix-turn-helix transcriptional regulator [Bacillus cereus]MDZ4557907.1 helix-turn-helix transcriptional regulator [Bacillus cereus]
MFNERLKQLRIEKNLTQQELAELTNLTKASISRFEGNKKTPSRESVTKLSKVLNVTTDYLLGLSDDPHLSSEQYSDLRKKFDVLLEKLEQKPKHEQEMLYKMMQAALGSDD